LHRAAWIGLAAAAALTTAAVASWLWQPPPAPVPPPPATDADGDALPPWALCRIGSARFRCAAATVAFTADGAQIVHGTTDGCVRVIDRRTGAIVREFAAQRGEAGRGPARSLLHQIERSFRPPWRDQLVAAAVSPDGARIATRGYRATNVWDIATGRRVAVWRDDAAAWPLAWTPDGGRVVTCDHQTGIDAHDAGSGRGVFSARDPRPLPRGYGGEVGVAVSPSGSLAAAQTYRLRVVDLASGAEVFATEPGEFAGPVAFSPDGAFLLHTRKNEAVVVRDTRTWTAVREISGPAFALAFSPDGSTLAIAGERLRVLDFATGAPRIEFPVRASRVAFSADGSTLAALVGVTVRVFDVVRGVEDPPAAAPFHSVNGLAWSPDGRRLAVADDVVLSVADSATGRIERSWETGGTYLVLDPFAAEGRRIGVVGHGPAEGEVWCAMLDTASETVPVRRPLAKAGWLVFDAAAGEMRAVVRAESEVRVTDVSGAQVLRLLPNLGWERLHDVDVSAGLVAVRGGTDREVDVHDLATGALLAEVAAPAAIVDASDVGSPCLADGRLVLFDDDRGAVAVFDARTGERQVLIEASAALDGWIAISRDGSLVAAFDREHAVRVFDGASGREVARLTSHRGSPRALVFSPDGRRLATASEDGTILIWDVAAATGR
jgi:WD40 repeat protein